MFFLVVKYVYDIVSAESSKWDPLLSGSYYVGGQFSQSNNFPFKISTKTTVYALNTYWYFIFESVKIHYDGLIFKIMVLTLIKLSNNFIILLRKWDFIHEYVVIQFYLYAVNLVSSSK